MDFLLKIGKIIFNFARASAHAYETLAIVLAISIISLRSSSLLADSLSSNADNSSQIQTKLDADHNAIVKNGPSAKHELFTQISTEQDPQTRLALLGFMNTTGLSAEHVVDVEPYLHDTDETVRSGAVYTLGNIGGAKAIQDLENTLQSDSNSGVRMAAAFWLGNLKSRSSVDVLGQTLSNDKDANVRTQCAQSLKLIKSPKAGPYLNHAQQDTDKRVRKLANET